MWRCNLCKTASPKLWDLGPRCGEDGFPRAAMGGAVWMPGPSCPEGGWVVRVRRPRPRRKPGPRPKPRAAPAEPAGAGPAPRTPPRRCDFERSGTGRKPRKKDWPECDSDGDPICPPDGDVSRISGISPYLRRVREGKRGADRLEEALTRGIRKARGQRVTPRKRRRKGAPLGQPPTVLGSEAFPPPQDEGRNTHLSRPPDPSICVAQSVQAFVEGPGPPVGGGASAPSSSSGG